ncbi:MAG: AAA family ATPase [Candidatus Aenigmatarchaeota archaeon]
MLRLTEMSRLIKKRVIASKLLDATKCNNKKLEYIIRAYLKPVPVIEGERGIGKTELLRQWGSLFGAGYSEFDASHLTDKFDIIGVPLESGPRFGFLSKFINFNAPKFIFIDEITKGDKAVRGMLNSLVTSKEIELDRDIKIDLSNRIIIGAQNPVDDRYELSSDVEDLSFQSRMLVYKIQSEGYDYGVWQASNPIEFFKDKYDICLSINVESYITEKNLEKAEKDFQFFLNWISKKTFNFLDNRQMDFLMSAIYLFFLGIEKNISLLYKELEPLFKDNLSLLQDIISFIKGFEGVSWKNIELLIEKGLTTDQVNILIGKIGIELKKEEIKDILKLIEKNKEKITKSTNEAIYKNLENALRKELNEFEKEDMKTKIRSKLKGKHKGF